MFADFQSSVHVDDDTICAVVTGKSVLQTLPPKMLFGWLPRPQRRPASAGQQGGAVSVLRLSGPNALAVASRVFSRPGKHEGQPWHAKTHRIYYGHIVDQAGVIVDEACPGGLRLVLP